MSVCSKRVRRASSWAPRSCATPRSTGDDVRAEKPSQEGRLAARPPTYEVQEGDTLYKIAVRFYGSIRAWKLIRDANKALISTDGRVQAGETIRLP
ncbi:MAG: LysM peptidoglycan-binding domain-containing protein [Kiritimatiellae bacterium]|nr:LysM peptidoglycan-binding domain-containing protein [Kiritimatiellia bacterium]